MQLNQKNGFEDNDKGIINRLWFKYFPYWPIFLLVFLLSGVGAWLYLRYTTPMYESTATILIKDEKKGFDDSKTIESLNMLSSKKLVENEIEVIHSRILMNEVVKNLHLYAPVFEKGKINPVSLYSNSPVSIEAKNTDSMIQADKVFFNIDTANKKVSFNSNSYPLNEWVRTEYGVLKFNSRNSTITPEAELFFSLVNIKTITLSLLKRLEVTSSNKLSTIINLKIKDEVPKRSEDILNGLILAYNKAALKDKNNLAANTLNFVEDRIGISENELDSIQRKLQNYKANTGSIDIGSQGKLFLEGINENDQKLSDVNLQLTVLDQVDGYIKSKDNSQGIAPSTVGINDPDLSVLLQKLFDTQLQQDKLSKTTAENNPLMLSVTDQINKIKPNIAEIIESRRKNLEASKNNYNSISNRYLSMLSTIPKKERDLVDISREQNIKTATYNFLLQKREEASLALASSMADSRVIDKAESSMAPVSPNRNLIYILSILLALSFCIGLITTNEMLNRSVMFRHEIETYTTRPIIGEIIYEKSKTPLVIGEGKRTFIAEQFRLLRTSLPYIGLHGERKKLLVTSTVPGDGKSFIVANLGISLAMTGKKVVLLEFDLSDPTLSEKLGVSQSIGLSEYLSDKADPEEIIQKTNINENLFIISAGELPDNPSELIVNSRVHDLMRYLSRQFDYIIIDTAPVGLLSDAYVLSAYCDATLYVVRHHHTPKLSLQRIDQNNEINELKNMAIVFNGIKSRGFTGPGYGYGFGYGYIHKENTTKRSKKYIA